MQRRLTPAEKKRLSLERDRREHYGQNDKASRRIVPLRKRQRARSERVRASQAARMLPTEIEDGDVLDVELLPTRGPGRWRKTPAQPLERDIAQRLARRIADHGAKVRRKGKHPSSD